MMNDSDDENNEQQKVSSRWPPISPAVPSDSLFFLLSSTLCVYYSFVRTRDSHGLDDEVAANTKNTRPRPRQMRRSTRRTRPHLRFALIVGLFAGHHGVSLVCRQVSSATSPSGVGAVRACARHPSHDVDRNVSIITDHNRFLSISSAHLSLSDQRYFFKNRSYSI